MKHTRSEIRTIKESRKCKLHPRDIQKKNKEAFDKSYFGQILLKINKNKELISILDKHDIDYKIV